MGSRVSTTSLAAANSATDTARVKRGFLSGCSAYSKRLLIGFGVAAGLVTGAQAQTDFPPAPYYFQTNQHKNPVANGDWYSADVSGNGSAYITIHVPADWPASADVVIDLLSADMNEAARTALVPNPRDESNAAIGATASVTEFELFAPGAIIDITGVPQAAPVGTQLAFQSYAPNSVPNGQYARFVTLPAPVTPGIYVLRNETHDAAAYTNQQNSFRVYVGTDNDNDPNNGRFPNDQNPDGLPGTGDEILIATPGQTFEHADSVNEPLFMTFYRFIELGQVNPTFHNFDMDGNTRIRYYAPSQVLDPLALVGGAPGTVSGNGVWNNGGGLNARVGDTVASAEDGYWRIRVGANNSNQYNLETSAEQPMFAIQPPTPVIALTKSDDVTPPLLRNDTITYTIDFTNTADPLNGGGPAYNLQIVDTLPSNVSFVSAQIDAPYTGSVMGPVGNQLTFDINERVDTGDSGSVTIVVQVNYDATGNVENTASASAEDSIGYRHASIPSVHTISQVLPAPPQIDGRIFNDANGNGVDDSEPGIGNVQVIIQDADGNFYQDTTDAFGNYSITVYGLGLAEVIVNELTLPSGFVLTTGNSSQIVPAVDNTVTVVSDVGYQQVESLSGTVFSDLNGDGIQQGGEPGAQNIVVVSTDSYGVVRTALTDVNGAYSFNVPAGNVTIDLDNSSFPTASVTTANDPQVVVVSIGVPAVAALMGIGNAVPVANNDIYNTQEDVVLNVTAPGVLQNDSDADGDPITAGLITVPSNGSVVLNADGSFVYMPDPNYNGVDSFTYQVSDGTDISNIATVTINIAPVADVPVANDDTFTTAEDTSITVTYASLQANDETVDGGPAIYNWVTYPSNGTISSPGGSSFVYTPASNFYGTDSFTYSITTPSGTSAPATVLITVTPVNDPAIGVPDLFYTDEDTPLLVVAPGVLGNDYDIEGDSFTCFVASNPLSGTLTLEQDGNFVYTPFADFHGTDAFSYYLHDNTGNGGPVDVTIIVRPINDNPVAGNDSYTVGEDGVLTIGAPGLLANDSDVDGDSFTVTVTTPPTNGVFQSGPDNTGAFTYQPNPDFNGTDWFVYSIEDGNGGYSLATVTITVTAVNDPPVANNDLYSTPEDTQLTVAAPGVIGNDFDVDGQPLSVAVTLNPTNGTLVLSSDGSFIYTPNSNFNGQDEFRYRLSDGLESDTARVRINVGPINDAPVVNIDVFTINEDATLLFNSADLLVNDTDADGDVLANVTIIQQPQFGTLIELQPGEFQYIPNSNYHGVDSFTYQTTDGTDNSNVATVTITVLSVNDPPVALPNLYSTQEDTQLVVSAPGVLINDFDVDGDPLTASIMTSPANGTVVLNADGSLTYMPNPNFFGIDSFTYRAHDGTLPSPLPPATVIILVGPVNDVPVAENDAYSVDEDQTLTVVAPGILGNDTDADGLGGLGAALINDVLHGSLSLNANGSFIYTPNPNYNGIDTFTYRVDDGDDVSNLATVTITVNPVNDAPIAASNLYTMLEDTPFTAPAPGVLGNDTDVDGDTLSALIVTNPTRGTVELNANGSFTYTPIPNLSSLIIPDTFTYRAHDGTLDSNLAIVTIYVIPVNDASVAENDVYATNEDVPLVVPIASGLRLNDSDVDHSVSSLAVSIQSLPLHGTLSGPVAQGGFTYTPDSNFHGVDTFRYRLTDPLGAVSNVATVTITVNSINDAPVALNNSYTLPEDTSILVAAPGVLSNDTDVDGDALSAVLISTTNNGTLALNGDGSFTYTPNANYYGADSFTYRASDGTAQSGIANVTLNITSVPDAPVAVDDAYSAAEDSTLTVNAAAGVQSNDYDNDGDTLTVVVVTNVSNGTLVLNANGSFTYTPNPNFSGVDTFTYQLSDPGGLLSGIATVTITVTGSNDAPVANDDAYSTLEATPLNVGAPGVLLNDYDADGDTLTAVLASNAASGSVTLAGDGSFVYTPPSGFSGLDTFTYHATDGTSSSAVATVSIYVGYVNEAPVAVNDSYTMDEDTILNVPVAGILGNDTDADATNTLTALLVTPPLHASAFTLNADGSFSYTPNANYVGMDSFSYQANDGMANSNVAVVTINVNNVNDAPIAANNAYSTMEDTSLSVNGPGVLINDTDVDGDALAAVLITGPSNGTLTLHPSGGFVYTPNADYWGSDSFTYRATDGTAQSNPATVTITVNGVNDAPVAQPDSYSTDEDTALTVPANLGLLVNDFDVDDTAFTVVRLSLPAHGTLTGPNNNGAFTYTPNSNFSGVDSFTYRLIDSGGAVSNIAMVTIAVNAVNDAPVASNDNYSTVEDQPLIVAAPGVLLNDSDVDGDTLSAVLTSNPTSGTIALSANGSFVYTPNANFAGSDMFTYAVSDGTTESNVATVTINVANVNDAPTAVNDAYSMLEDDTLTVPAAGVLANDSDTDGDTLAAILVNGVLHGTLSLSGDGSFTYTPNPGYHGSDSFSYRAFDGLANSNIATVTIAIGSVNDAPVANDDTYSTPEDTPITVPAPGVLTNDFDLDGDILAAVLVDNVSSGVLNLNVDGSFTYTPNSNVNGTDRFTYVATDGTSQSVLATVLIHIGVVNDAPESADDSYSVSEDETLVISAAGVLLNDSDPDGDSLVAQLLLGPQNASSFTLNTDGSFTYTPTLNFNGVDTFFYQATDGVDQSAVSMVTITVNPVNDAPVALPNIYTTMEDTPFTAPAPGVLGNDTDVDGDSLTATIVTNPTRGVVVLNANGSFTYTPNSDVSSAIIPDVFTYRAHDGVLQSNLATVMIWVLPVNDAPVANDDAYSTNEDTALTVPAGVGLLANDSDVDDTAFTVGRLSLPSHGILTGPNNNGAFIYTPNANFHGVDSFTYRLIDGSGALSNIATVTITVHSVNDAPVAGNNNYTLTEDSVFSAPTPGVLANDTDADGDTLSAVLISSTTNGTLNLNSDGSFTYTPNANFHGTDGFVYRAWDGIVHSNLANVTLNVTSVPDAPIALDDAYWTAEDSTLNVNAVAGLLLNDYDNDGEALVVQLIVNVSNGTLTLNADGSFTYEPNADFAGVDSFTYRAVDTAGFLSNVATATITVSGENDAPVALPDAYSTNESTPLVVAAPGVLINDTDVDGDTLTVVLVNNANNGNVALAANGSFVYTPSAGFSGVDTFTYKATDGVTESAVVSVTVTVGYVNEAPVAVNDSYSVNEDSALNVPAAGVLTNDTDADATNTLTALLVTPPLHASSFTLNADGSFNYTPQANFYGTDSFSYQAFDGMANSNVATVTITVNPVNDAPVANLDTFYTMEDLPITVPAPGVMGNDTDVDGDTLTAILVGNPLNGTVALNADGSFTYTPNPNYSSLLIPDVFTYRVSDGIESSAVEQVRIYVLPVNDAPVAGDDAYTTPEDTNLVVAAPGLKLNDSDVDNSVAGLTITVMSGPTNGSLVSISNNGSFTYAPNPNFSDVDTFTYRLTDISGAVSNIATVTITVTADNDLPVALNDSYSTSEETPITVEAPGVLSNDTDDDGDLLTAVLVNNPTSGTLVLNANGGFTYTPNADFEGVDTFTYRAHDGTGESNLASVTITVNGINDAPVATDDVFTTDEDTTLNIAVPGVLGNDSDIDEDNLTAELVNGVMHGTLVLQSDGSFDYTPNAGYHGVDTFAYQASDGLALSNMATVVIQVGSVNDAPVANEDLYSTPEDTPITVATPGVLTNDYDLDGDILTAVLVDNPTSGILNLNGDGSFTYQPNPNVNGTDWFTYVATDGTSSSAVTTVTINIGVINDVPVAVVDSYSVNEDETLTVPAAGILINDSDADGDSLVAQLVAPPSHAASFTLNGDGNFTYTPTLNFHGTDSFLYQATDGLDQSNVVTVTITVLPVNDRPIANLNLYSTAEDTPLIVATPGILGNDVDIDGDTMTALLVNSTSNGSLALNADGSFVYVPNANFSGLDTFTYRAHDGTLPSALPPATVFIFVEEVNDVPVANDDSYTVNEDEVLTIPAPGILGNDTDADDDFQDLETILVNPTQHGALVFNNDGSFTYTPNLNYHGLDSFTYLVTDGEDYSGVATVYITVLPVNDAPVATANFYSTPEDTALAVPAPGILGNDTDVDGDSISAMLVTNPSFGTLALNANGSFIYTPNPNFASPPADTFVYRAFDGSLQSNLQTVTIVVTPVNDAPVAGDDNYTTLEDTPLTVGQAVGLRLNDSDADHAITDLTVTIMSGPSHGTLSGGTISQGGFIYTPNANFHGLDFFTYRLTDPAGAVSNTATVTIVVQSENDLPVAVGNIYTTVEDVPLVVAAPGVLGNDVDNDGDPLTVLLTSNPTSGTLNMQANGGFLYTPNPDFNGTDSFTYRAHDGVAQSNQVTVTINVLPINDAPLALDDNYVMDEGTVLQVAVPGILGNDVDVDGDSLDALLVDNVLHGTLVLSPDGSFVYTPNPNYHGMDSFTYRVFDGSVTSNLATVTIVVGSVNDAPIANEDVYSTPEDSPITVAAPGILTNDFDLDGDILTAVLVDNVLSGTLQLNADGSFTYSPNPNVNGADWFTYIATDGTSHSLVTTVTLNIGPNNDIPVSADDAYSIDEDTTLNIMAPGVLLNDSDADGDTLQAQLLLGPQHAASFTLNADGSFDYTSALNFTGVDTFFYQATDGMDQSGVTMVTITVNPVNDAPVATSNTYLTMEDTPLVVAAPGVLGNDSDVDGDSLTAILSTNPLLGTVQLNADGSFIYTPNPDVPSQNLFPVSDTFTYRANDGTENSNLATVTIIILPVNDAPVAVDDSYSTDEDTPFTVSVANGLRLNDYDVDNSNASLTVNIMSSPSHGTLSGPLSSGGFTYTPAPEWNGVDSFTYRLTDPLGAESNTATVTITVHSVNDVPVVANDAYSTVEDVPLVVAAPGVLINDTDNDGDALTAVLVDGTSNGVLALNANGGFVYTPNPNFHGADSFTYRATDGASQSFDLATVTITVAPVNDAPVALDDAYVTNEETQLLVNAALGLLKNDSDVDGDSLTSVLVQGPQHAAAFALGANGNFAYTPETGFSGTDSFTYRAFDGTAYSNIATVTITVTPINDAPVANPDLFSTLEEMLLTVAAPGVLANDTDEDGDTLTAILVDNVASGTLVLNGDGSLSYLPAVGFNGMDQFTYRASDGLTVSDVTTVTITVGIENDVPVAVNDNYVTNEDTTLTVPPAGVLNNDTDEDGDPLLAVLINGPLHSSTFTLNSDGSFTYTPIIDFHGVDSFTYQATDGISNSNVATVTIMVQPANDVPVAVEDIFSTVEDTPLVVAAPGVLVNDTDAEGDELTSVLQDNPTSGIVSLNGDGSFIYTPLPDFSGTDWFTYYATDGLSASNLTTVTIVVAPVNDAPVAANDEYYMDEDTTLTIPAPGVLANDSDVDGHTLTPQVIMAPLHAAAFSINPDGSFTYEPLPNFNGTDSFTYQAFDGSALSNVATVTIVVRPVNDAPIGVVDSFQLTEDTPLVVAAPGILANDFDGDGDSLTSVLVNAPIHGTLALNANGGFTYSPNSDYSGFDEFVYVAHDGVLSSEPTTVSLTILPVNDAPVGAADNYVTDEDTPLNISAPGVLANDTDADSTVLTAVLVTGPLHASAFTFNSDGSFDYTPAVDYHGTDTFVYRASDGAALSEPVTVTIVVNPNNDAPVALADSFSTAEDTPLVVAAPGVLVNDTDADGDSLTAVLVNGPANGTVALNGNGSFTYTPNADFNGLDTFTYTAFDGYLNSPVVTVEIDVTPVNDVPVAVDNTYVVDEDTTLTIEAPGVLLNDYDAEGTFTLSAMLVVPPVHGSVTLDAYGGFTYVPNLSFSGTDSFGYQAFDGFAMSNVATVIIEVLPINDAPVANDDMFSTNEDTPLTVAATGILANDVDADGDTLTAILIDAPVHGTLQLDGNGGFTYTPGPGHNGADTFTYQAFDGTAVSNLATVTINTVFDNDAPVANDDLFVTDEDVPLNVPAPGILANDTDEDGDTLQVARVVNQPLYGTVTVAADGSFLYTPGLNFAGTDYFTYQATDGLADSNIATVTISVGAVNDAPIANEDAFSTAEDVPLVVAAPGVLINDTDPDGDALTAVLTNGPTNGVLALNGDGSFTYTPNLDFNGIDLFTYQAFDGFLNSDVTTVTLTVGSANDAPVAKNDKYTTQEDTQLDISAPGVLINDTDEDGDSLSSVIFSNPVNGTVTLNPDGSFSYMPNLHFNGEDTFCYRAFDGLTYSQPAKVTIIVTPVNDVPEAFDDAFSTPEDVPLVVAAQGVLTNDVDHDGDIMIAILVDNAQNGIIQLDGSGAFVYTPNPNFHGTDTFTYKAFDGVYNSNVATVTINVTPVNDVPVAVDDVYVLQEDSTLTVLAPGILGNDVDVDGDLLTAVLITPPLHGSLSLNANGGFTYTPNLNYNGTDSFVYRANDGTVNSNTATVHLTITPVNDIPTITVTAANPINENDLAIFMAVINDPDVGNSHTFTINWADGTPPEVYQFGPGQTVISISHRYLDDDPTGTPSDIYNIAYAIEDNNMGASFGTQPLVVNNVAPKILNLFATQQVQLGQVVTLTGSFVDPGTKDTFTMSINWGDGSPLQIINYLQPQGFSFNHTYADPGPHTITVTVTDDDTGSDTQTAITTVSSSADLSIMKTATPDPALVGEEITYMLLITNNGPSVATGVQVVDIMPANVEVISTVPDCTEVSGTLVFELGSLGPGQSTRVTIVGKLMQQGGITNIATVTGNEADPNLANNVAQITTTVIFGPPPDGADIAGEFVWVKPPKAGAKKWKITGNVMIVNRGTVMASRFVSRIYLSDDTELDTSDTVIWTKKIRRMKPQRAHRFRFQGKVPLEVNPTGKFLILRMDEGDLVREIIETNNIVVAPVPVDGYPYPL